MKKAFLILLFAISINTYSQEVLLEQNVKADTIRPTKGPNLKNFVYGYIGIGFPVATEQTAKYTIPVTSLSSLYGVRYKRKLTNTLAIGLDLGLNLTAYKLKQNQGKEIPDTVINTKEKFQINSTRGSAFVRLNVGRRGNYIGNFLDLGGYGDWNMVKKHKTTNQNDLGERVKVITSRLPYVENLSYGLLARIGSNRYSITASYRLSDLFKSSYSMPELPRLIVGFEIGLFK